MRLSDLPPNLRVQAERQLYAPAKTPPAAAPREARHRPPVRVPAPRVPNRTESRFNDERLGGRGIYEGITFNVPSGKYTPDWVYYGMSSVICVEVKGSYRLGSQSGASAKFKEAVALHPGITFVWAKLAKDGTWHCETIPPRPRPPAVPDDSSRAPVHTPTRDPGPCPAWHHD